MPSLLLAFKWVSWWAVITHFYHTHYLGFCLNCCSLPVRFMQELTLTCCCHRYVLFHQNPQEFNTKLSSVITTLKTHKLDSQGCFKPLVKQYRIFQRHLLDWSSYAFSVLTLIVSCSLVAKLTKEEPAESYFCSDICLGVNVKDPCDVCTTFFSIVHKWRKGGCQTRQSEVLSGEN